MKKLKSRFNNFSLKTKIVLIIVIVNLLLFSSVASFGLHIITTENNKQLYSSMAASLTYSAENIRKNLENIESMSQMFVVDGNVQGALATLKDTEDTLARKEAYRQLNTVLQNYRTRFGTKYIYYMSLYSGGLSLHTDTARAKKLPVAYVASLRSKAAEQSGTPVWTGDYAEEYGLFLSQQIRRVEPMTLDELGKLNICVRFDKLVENSVNTGSHYDESYYIVMDEEQELYVSPNLPANAAEAVLHMEENTYQVLKLDGKHYFAVRGGIEAFGWQYVSLVSYEESYKAILLAEVLYFFVIILSFILSAIVAGLLISRLMRHIDFLISKMKVFGEKEASFVPSPYDYSGRQDEIGLLHREFDRMAGDIVRYIQTDYANRLLMKDAQIKALEAQIDPHFLYNVLASVNWRAKAIGETKISDMVEALSKLLRATLSGTEEEFTLEMEMALVENYMTIQQIRYEELLQFSMNIPRGLLDAQIPKLTIQPLVENAIRYALEENDEVCKVQVDGCQEAGLLHIYVRNSGSELREDLLQALEDKTAQAQGFGIGLVNIQRRLQLCFGPEYGLHFFNENGMAVVEMRIPYTPKV